MICFSLKTAKKFIVKSLPKLSTKIVKTEMVSQKN